MRLTVLVGLSAVCFGVGFGVGFSHGTKAEVEAEPDLDTLFTQWALRYWRPDWPAP